MQFGLQISILTIIACRIIALHAVSIAGDRINRLRHLNLRDEHDISCKQHFKNHSSDLRQCKQKRADDPSDHELAEAGDDTNLVSTLQLTPKQKSALWEAAGKKGNALKATLGQLLEPQ